MSDPIEILVGQAAPSPRRSAAAAPPLARRASSYAKKRIEWLWPEHFALRMLGLIDGDPSRGKSMILARLAGHVTTAEPWPDGSECPSGGFVLVGAEDAIAETWVPRLEAAGADLDRVKILPAKPDGTPIRLPEDIRYLEREMQDVDARIIAFDPIMSCLAGLANPNSDKDVRQAITPLNDILQRNRCAGVMLRHFNKDDKTSLALNRGMASVAFGALARTGFAVAKDPDVAGGFILAPTKNNLARFPAALRYRIADVDLGAGFVTARIEWQGESQRSAEELVTAFGGQASKAADAEQLMRQWLADGPILSDRLLDLAKDATLSFATYRRVKEDVLRCKAGQWKGRWYTFLPEQLQMWELMRASMAETASWAAVPASDAHVTGSDAHDEHLQPGAEGQMLIGSVIHTPSNGHSPESTYKHLISGDEHLATPDAQMLIASETTRARADLDGAFFDAAYLDEFGAQMDAEAAELEALAQ